MCPINICRVAQRAEAFPKAQFAASAFLAGTCAADASDDAALLPADAPLTTPSSGSSNPSASVKTRLKVASSFCAAFVHISNMRTFGSRSKRKYNDNCDGVRKRLAVRWSLAQSQRLRFLLSTDFVTTGGIAQRRTSLCSGQARDKPLAVLHSVSV